MLAISDVGGVSFDLTVPKVPLISDPGLDDSDLFPAPAKIAPISLTGGVSCVGGLDLIVSTGPLISDVSGVNFDLTVPKAPLISEPGLDGSFDLIPAAPKIAPISFIGGVSGVGGLDLIVSIGPLISDVSDVNFDLTVPKMRADAKPKVF